ncbi:calcium-transporting ATPase [Rhodotorula toruloides]|uniref:Calcium-transporting ATPase n=1 Tax=Rhodotorula toruloides TaxID=5286 RepID=A0A511KGG4_RHOTO|nr:calcium-transporting ATPase [Rhodotorula toruloides]
MAALAHTQTPDSLAQQLHVALDNGLTASQVAENQRKYGKNVLPEEPSPPLWELILDQFKDQLVLILLASAGISLVLAYLEEGEDKATAYVEPIVILAILIANAWVGVVQETNAEKAIEALMEYSPDEAKVLRDGRVQKIHAVDLVPGDVISLAVGDKVPADSRVVSISSASFTIDQALLTGESHSVSKSTAIVKDEKAVKQDMVNMLFSGTTVVTGKARALVVATGTQTAIGDIHTSITSQISEKTPLKQKVDDFGEQLAKVIAVICILVWVVNVRNFNDPSHGGLVKGAIYYFKIAVALAVAAIPEGLPAVITTCLALGTKKMARKNAIVRSLPSVETLGSTNVICSDKTGTLTTNQMSVARVSVVEDASLKQFEVEGTTYAPTGDLLEPNGAKVDPQVLAGPPFTRLAEIASLCNDAKIAYAEKDNSYTSIGEPTEAALRVLVEKIGASAVNSSFSSLSPQARVNAVNTDIESRFARLLTFEFSRDRKSMSVLVREKNATTAALFVKGAPESVAERCDFVDTGLSRQPLTQQLRDEINKTVLDYGSQGLRTLALAYVDDVDPDADHYHTDSSSKYIAFEQKMTFAGLVGMLDPPRPEVRGAIEKCKTAGVRVVVITGDNKNTAETICRQIGVFGDTEDLTGKSYTGKEFDALSQQDKISAVLNASLFSRTEPGHKLQIVELLQEQGLVCAMTGDGVNDAPALRRAAIVAKLASDMVLADDNFASIEAAIEEGRSIYENTKQFIRYLISSNIGEVVSIFLTVLLGMPEALLSVQLLWVNLVTDGLPATALGFNPPDHSIMRRPPRSSKEPLISGWLFFRYLIIGIYVGCATVFGYAWWFMFYKGGPQISWYQLTHFHKCSELFPSIGCDMFANEMAKRATTISLSILVVIEMFNALNSLAENESLLTLPPWRNMYLVGAIALSMALHFMILYVPFFATLFQITPLNLDEWKAVVAISFPVILIDEALKLISNAIVAPSAKEKTE